jgi:hypothetical protein
VRAGLSRKSGVFAIILAFALGQIYRQKGIVGPQDCAVIAINICRLSDLDADGNGIGQYPLAMEALYPIGVVAVPINPEWTLGNAENVPRFELSKATGHTIGTGCSWPAGAFTSTRFT